MDVEKIAPQEVVSAVLDALEAGTSEVLVDAEIELQVQASAASALANPQQRRRST